MIVFLRDCDACGFSEERVWTDSYTQLSLCQQCLGMVLNTTTNSPWDGEDNLREELRNALGDDLQERIR